MTVNTNYTIVSNCKQCDKPITQTLGKRAKLYCRDSCRQKAYQTANKVEMVSISRLEYERLLAIESKFSGIKDIPDSLYSDSNNSEIADLMKKQRNTKQNKIKSTDEAVLKPETIKTTPLDVKCPPMGLSKIELAVWRRNNQSK
jgi:hypothetical protein